MTAARLDPTSDPSSDRSTDHSLDLARTVADAVLYEGYLLYPYRASSGKNQSRWQFGVLGPRGALEAGVGEEPGMVTECLVRHDPGSTLTLRLRFLQLQARCVERADGAAGFVPSAELRVDGTRWLTWDEAVEHEVEVGTVALDQGEVTGQGGVSGQSEVSGQGEFRVSLPVAVEGGGDVTELLAEGGGEVVGRIVRRRRPLSGVLELSTQPVADVPGVSRLRVEVANVAEIHDPPDRADAVGLSFLGAHLLMSCAGGEFVSMTDPPAGLRRAVEECRQHRCWPVLAGPRGRDDVLLVSPIILEDHPTVSKESPGSLFDSTEIDEILTLRILTMTEDEKAEARATDPRAAGIIDRSEALSAQDMSRLHATMRDPHVLEDVPQWPPAGNGAAGAPDVTPWWAPEMDSAVDPATDTVLIAGTQVGRGSLVVVHPSRRADAQDLFFAGQTGRVTGVHFDVDGSTHVAVVLVDDPAADLHDWYGRYLYFDPDELEPTGSTAAGSDTRREMRS